MTATFFWRIFEETGSINAYLAYRQLFQMGTGTSSSKNYIQ
ncbi:MAG: hypothetical protein ACOCZ3_02115 [Bacillota bacterium]